MPPRAQQEGQKEGQWWNWISWHVPPGEARPELAGTKHSGEPELGMGEVRLNDSNSRYLAGKQ
ncbi:hypothetical protein BaRGS_00000436, partial [Batillaria attramentaria]